MLRIIGRAMSSFAANRSIDGPIAKSIVTKIQERFQDLQHFAIYNDSYKHAGHHGIAEADNKIESHFRLEIVSDEFKGMTLPKRHRLVYSILDEELKGDVHALQLTTRTAAEQSRKN